VAGVVYLRVVWQREKKLAGGAHAKGEAGAEIRPEAQHV
jgi:hypothetical protein